MESKYTIFKVNVNCSLQAAPHPLMLDFVIHGDFLGNSPLLGMVFLEKHDNVEK